MSIIAYGMYLLVRLCLLSFNFFLHANIVADSKVKVFKRQDWL